MTFAAKYEILEPVAVGPVEIFVARKVLNNERVLVHIFECPEQKPQQPTLQWVLESFHAVAPEPAELVIDTGKYLGTSYAYLVTKIPAEAVLKQWIQSYEARGQATNASAEPPLAAAPAPAEEVISPLPILDSDQPTLVRSHDQTQEITKAFEALRLGLAPQSKPTTGSGVPAAAGPDRAEIVANLGELNPPAPQEPGEFTKQFFAGLSGEREKTSAVPSRSGVAEARTRQSPSGIEPVSGFGKLDSVGLPGGTTDILQTPRSPGLDTMFSSTAATREKAARDAGPGQADLSTGEFTHYFRGPFNGERAQETPDVSSSQPRPPAEPAGEFTEIFGRSNKDSGSSTFGTTPKPKEASSAAPDSGGFTDLFAKVEKPPKSLGPEDLSRSKPPSSIGGEFAGPKDPLPSLTPSPLPFRRADSLTLTPPPSKTPELRPVGPRFSPEPEAEGSTRIFSVPEKEALPDLSDLRAGPSEYTRVISRGSKSLTPTSEPPIASGSESPSVAGPGLRFPAPPAPAVPPPPPVPQFPHAPAYPQMSAPPPVAAPPVPAAPQLGAAKPAKVPWALILALNGLLILAELLVVYFVLNKH
jgi:hypothetical protein